MGPADLYGCVAQNNIWWTVKNLYILLLIQHLHHILQGPACLVILSAKDKAGYYFHFVLSYKSFCKIMCHFLANGQ